MGNIFTTATSQQIPMPPPPFFTILTREQGERQLEANEQLDGFVAACMKCDVNRRAMQHVEVCNPPADARVACATPMPDWLSTIRGTNVVFFLEGLPHTRELSAIYLPYNSTAGPSFKKTLIHESIHVHQRIFRDRWHKVFSRAWDMKPWAGKLPAELQARRRLNPDTHLEPLFVWRDRFVPLMVFDRADAPRLGACHCIWLNVETGSHNSVPPPGWLDFFLTDRSSICEHPCEMAAYMLTAEVSTAATAMDLLKKAIAQEFSVDI